MMLKICSISRKVTSAVLLFSLAQCNALLGSQPVANGEQKSIPCQTSSKNVVFMDRNVLCIKGRLYDDSFQPETFSEVSIDVVVVDGWGGSLKAFMEIGRFLADCEDPPLFTVQKYCMSACAMALLPYAENLIISEDALIITHRYVFDTFDEFYSFYMASPRRPVPETDEEAEKQVELIEIAYQRYKSILDQIDLRNKRYDLKITDAYSQHAPCYRAEYGFDAFDYYTIVSKEFYARYIDTRKWVWKDGKEDFDFSYFDGPVCNLDGETVYLPDR